MLKCLTDIIGVTDSENDCILQGLTEEEITNLKKSTSGLLLDDLPGGAHMKAVKFADATKSFYMMAMDAKENAIKAMEDSLITALNTQYKKNRANFVGLVGAMSYAQNLATTGEWMALRLRPVDIGTTVFNLTKITLAVNLGATFNIYLYKVPYGSAAGQFVRQWQISTAPNAYTSLFVDQAEGGARLPLAENGEAVEYWFLWSRTESGGAVPKDTKVKSCSHCEKTGLENFMEVNGVSLNDLTNFTAGYADNYTRGMILEGSVKCDNEALMCGEYNGDDAVAISMAYAVWYKAGELLIEDVLKSPDLNRYTTMDRTYLWGKRNHFRAEFDKRITYLAAAIDVTASNCYLCRSAPNQPFAAPIFT